MWYTFFGKFHDTSLWILHEMHDASLCDAPDELYVWNNFRKIQKFYGSVVGAKMVQCHQFTLVVGHSLLSHQLFPWMYVFWNIVSCYRDIQFIHSTLAFLRDKIYILKTHFMFSEHWLSLYCVYLSQAFLLHSGLFQRQKIDFVFTFLKGVKQRCYSWSQRSKELRLYLK